MANYLNTTCSICGHKYHICNDCSKTASFTPWRSIACSANCYKIFMALNAYTNKHASKKETKQLLKRCDLSKLDTFEVNIKSSVEDILKDDTKNGKNQTWEEQSA